MATDSDVPNLDLKLYHCCTSVEPKRAERVREFLADGAKANCACLFEKTPLHWLVSSARNDDAAAVGIAVATTLLEFGADTSCCDTNGMTVLHAAAENNDCSERLLNLIIENSTTETLKKETPSGQTALTLWLQRQTVCQKGTLELFLNNNAVDVTTNLDNIKQHPFFLLAQRPRDEVTSLIEAVNAWSKKVANDEHRPSIIELALRAAAAAAAKTPIATIAKVFLKSADDFDLIKDAHLLSTIATKITVIRGHPDPILTLTKIGHMCLTRSNELQKRLMDTKNGEPSDIMNEIQCLERLSSRLETFACNLLDQFQPSGLSKERAAVCEVLSREAVDIALENRWDKFLQNDCVWLLIQQWWYVKKNVKETNWIELIVYTMLYSVQALFLPIILIYLLFCHDFDYNYCIHNLPFPPQQCPCAFYVTRALGYVLFVAVGISHVASGGATTSHLTALEWIIFLYVIGLLGEKVHEGWVFSARELWCCWKTYADIFMLIFFVVYFIARFVGQDDDLDRKLESARIANHALGGAVLISILRILPFLVVHSRIGPMQLSLVKIAPNAIHFFVILAVFLIAFAVSAKSVYEAGYYTHEGQGKALPATSSCLADFLWAMLGLESIESFTAISETETTVIRILLALWQTISVLVLLTMLIALITHAFDKIQEQRVGLFRLSVLAKLHILEKKNWPSPLPISLFILLIQFMSAAVVQCRRESSRYQSQSKYCDDDTLKCDSIGRMVMGYITRKRKERMKKRSKEMVEATCQYQLHLLLEMRQLLVPNTERKNGVTQIEREGSGQASHFGSTQWSTSSDKQVHFQSGMSTPRTIDGQQSTESESDDDIGEEDEEDDNMTSNFSPLLALLRGRRRRRVVSVFDGVDGFDQNALEGSETTSTEGVRDDASRTRPAYLV